MNIPETGTELKPQKQTWISIAAGGSPGQAAQGSLEAMHVAEKKVRIA
jgi:hypothetical protein